MFRAKVEKLFLTNCQFLNDSCTISSQLYVPRIVFSCNCRAKNGRGNNKQQTLPLFSSVFCRKLLSRFSFFSSGEDGKKFKTRSGETVKLSDLLLEAVRIAGESIRKRRADEGGEGYQASPRFTYTSSDKCKTYHFSLGFCWGRAAEWAGFS